MRPFCPLCASEDHASEATAEDGRPYLICLDKDHGEEGFIWEPPPPPGRSQRGDGLGAELEIWDKLLDCVPADGAVYSYGEVEDRFIEQFPSEARTLMLRYGHRWRYPDHRSGQYSMSSYLAARLKELEKEGALVLTWGPAADEWSYNSVISHWKRA